MCKKYINKCTADKKGGIYVNIEMYLIANRIKLNSHSLKYQILPLNRNSVGSFFALLTDKVNYVFLVTTKGIFHVGLVPYFKIIVKYLLNI